MKFIEALEEIAEHNRKRVEEAGGDQNFAKDLVYLPHEEFAVYDPFVDETMRFVVDPIEYYGLNNCLEMAAEYRRRFNWKTHS